MRIALATTLAAITLASRGAPAQSRAACSARTGAAEEYGPATTVGDSGLIYSSLISPSGTEFYFFRKVTPGREDYRIFRSLKLATGWSAPERVDLGGEYSDLYPAISPDGRRLVFSSYRPAPGDSSTEKNAHLWFAERSGRAWGSPRFVSASALGHYHSGLSYGVNGALRYNRTSPDWRRSERREIRWQDSAFVPSTAVPEHPAVTYWRSRLGDSLHVWGALATPDGRALLQVSRVTQPGNRRAPAHYFVSSHSGDVWSLPHPAPDGLSRGAPNFAWYSDDGCYLHYTEDYSRFMRIPAAALAGAR